MIPWSVTRDLSIDISRLNLEGYAAQAASCICRRERIPLEDPFVLHHTLAALFCAYETPFATKKHIIRVETLSSASMQRFLGGKGFNQSIALCRAGIPVFHAGAVGPDGEDVLAALRESGVNTQYIARKEEPTGHALIQLGADGQNAIVLFGGANRCNTTEHIDSVLNDGFAKGDIVLLQNEINHIAYIIDKAHERGLRIFMNPSPYSKALLSSFEKVDMLLINEIEGMQITAGEEPGYILEELSRRYPNMSVVLTLGREGVIYKDRNITCRHGAYNVPVVDTTAAGDTFTGHFIGALLREKSIPEALELASMASALSVSAKGAYPSIPTLEAVKASQLQMY
jgi:ribokinase